MLTCKEVTRLVSQGMDRDLAFPERAALQLHLVACRGCNSVKEQMEFLRKAVRSLVDGGNDRGR
jgi:hypothetical protein